MAALVALPVSAGANSKSYIVEGGLAGLAVGSGAGVGIGYAACGGNAFYSNRPTGMIMIGVAMGALGFAGGALIGYHYKKAEKTAIVPTFLIDPDSNAYGLGLAANF